MNRLSEHFTWQEMEFSQTARRSGVDNRIPDDLKANMIRTAHLAEQVRQLLNRPMIITSGYRSPGLNNLIGGSKRSQHMKAEAIDFVCHGISPREISLLIYESDIIYDQLIYEIDWVHLSQSEMPRRATLTAMFKDGEVTYRRGIL